MSTIKPRTAKVTIFQGDDLERLSQLDGDVERTEIRLRQSERAGKDAPPRTLDEQPTDVVASARDAHDAAKAERDAFASDAEARGVTVVLHALQRKQWRELYRNHPARPDVREDTMGVNMDEFPDALLPLSVCRDMACPIAHDPTTIEGDLDEFLESLGDYDYYDRLFLTAFALNRGSATADPTRRLGFVPSQTSDATSN
jgi:hypothetical protein